MNIVVCLRQSAEGDLNPFDACAYEAALQIPNADITLLSMAAVSSEPFITELTRLGAKRAVLLADNAFAGADTLATAYTLSLAVKRLRPHLVFCGRQTVDGATGQVGPEIAAMTGFNFIRNVMKIESSENNLICFNRENKRINAVFPSLLTVEKINRLRFPGMRSKTIQSEVWNAAELHTQIGRCGINGSPTRVIKIFESEQDKRKCKYIKPEEFKVAVKDSLKKPDIQPPKAEPCQKSLKNVLIVGEAPRKIAMTVSDDISVLPTLSVKAVADEIKKRNPSAVLWGNDEESKTAAAQTAALLQLGLCADCTALETDGSELFMYRPALAGSVTAKIRSLTRPQMATMHTPHHSGYKIAVGAGAGAKECLAQISSLAKKLNAELVATRSVVDCGFFPYSMQVGLSGKCISPDVYIALGVSGAVHHIAGIKSAKIIIAVNPDPGAPIFNYADIGIVCSVQTLFNFNL